MSLTDMRSQNSQNYAKTTLKSIRREGKKVDSSVKIFGLPIIGTHRSLLLKKLWLQRKEMLHIATVNPEYVMQARTNVRFAQVLAQCLTVADGYGVVWAAHILLGQDIERISGQALVKDILAHANLHHEKVFLLGAASGVAEQAAATMHECYPDVRFGWYEGAKTVQVEASEEASMTIAKINGFEPDYLLVAYGSPWQDIWIEANRPYLRVRVAIGVGGVLNEWAGKVAACPAWIDQLGFQWLWRLIHEPKRLRRILKVWEFGFLVLYMKFKTLF